MRFYLSNALVFFHSGHALRGPGFPGLPGGGPAGPTQAGADWDGPGGGLTVHDAGPHPDIRSGLLKLWLTIP